MRAASPILLCCTSLLPGALGLRLSRNASEAEALDVAGELAAAELEHWALPRNSSAADEPPLTEEAALEMADSEQEHVPHFERFKQAWTRRYSMETHLQEPLPKEVQLVLGLLTVAEDGSFRQVVRETWLRQAGVCYWSSEPQQDCSVYAAFVIAKTGNSSHGVNVSMEEMALAQSEEGMLVLDAVENMNQGKSFMWFLTARKMFPWATHFGKMDMDTYPCIHKLLYRMKMSLPCAGDDGPYEFIGRPHQLCRPQPCRNFTEACPASRCPAQFRSRQDTIPLGEGWRFLQGQFYILSRPLLEKLQIDPRRKKTWGCEDQVMSRKVEAAARKEHFCVTIKRPDAWYHKNFESDPEYINNF